MASIAKTHLDLLGHVAMLSKLGEGNQTTNLQRQIAKTHICSFIKVVMGHTLGNIISKTPLKMPTARPKNKKNKKK